MSSASAAERAAKVTKALAEHSAGVRRHLPVVQPRDAVELVAGLHRALDELAVQREAEARRDGAAVACSTGCSSCCHTAVMVFEPEAMRAAEQLARPEHAEARAHFLAQYPAWHDALGKDAERIRTLHSMGRIEDAERIFFRLQARRVMCAFNRDGLCTIYEVRPAICRNTHALDTAANCQPDAAHGPTVMGFAPMDQLMAQVPAVTSALQDALRRKEASPPEALCAAVHRLLERDAGAGAGSAAGASPGFGARVGLATSAAAVAEPSRNGPCPCGSGAKLKHCCDF